MGGVSVHEIYCALANIVAANLGIILLVLHLLFSLHVKVTKGIRF